MSDTHSQSPESGLEGMSREDMQSALFGQMILRQANMTAMLLGKVPHPEGQTIKDVEAAKLFIDELEMLEAKTRGNLSKEETHFLKQTLMSLRMAFVEAVEAPAAAEPAKQKPPEPAAEASAAAPSGENAASAEKEERHTKFTKKY
jgi:hypothetical protein